MLQMRKIQTEIAKKKKSNEMIQKFNKIEYVQTSVVWFPR